jgi:hypothetical protein
MDYTVQPGQLLIDPALRFNPEVLRAVRGLARAKPWRGDLAQRMEKFHDFAAALAAAAGFEKPALEFDGVDADTCSGASYYNAQTHTVRLVGRLSVVTLLRLLGYAAGMSEMKSTKWTINIFNRCFPISFARCRFEGYMLRRGALVA